MVLSKTQLRREVANLSARLSNVTTAPSVRGRRRRVRGRRRGAAQNNNVAAGCSSNPNPVRMGPPNRRARGGGGASIGNGGRIVLRRDEMILSCATDANKTETVFKKILKPSSDCMPFLFRLAACYQRIKWRSMAITWRPSVGTSTNGIITYGIAYNNQEITNRQGITSLSPVNDHPIWQSGASTPLVIPANMLMTRKWYELNTSTRDPYDQAVGSFYVGLTHDAKTSAESRGEFWVRYTIEMEGTNNA